MPSEAASALAVQRRALAGEGEGGARGLRMVRASGGRRSAPAENGSRPSPAPLPLPLGASHSLIRATGIGLGVVATLHIYTTIHEKQYTPTKSIWCGLQGQVTAAATTGFPSGTSTLAGASCARQRRAPVLRLLGAVLCIPRATWYGAAQRRMVRGDGGAAYRSWAPAPPCRCPRVVHLRHALGS